MPRELLWGPFLVLMAPPEYYPELLLLANNSPQTDKLVGYPVPGLCL